MWFYRHPEMTAVIATFLFFGLLVAIDLAMYWAAKPRERVLIYGRWHSVDEIKDYPPPFTDGRAWRNKAKAFDRRDKIHS